MGDPFRLRRPSVSSPASDGFEHGYRCLIPWPASRVKDLDMYLADLYEGIDAKIRATRLIFTLATRTEWLESLASHGSALGAIARVLREEGRKSFHLRFNILSICSIFSLFHKFHQILLEHKIGKTTLAMMALEVQRSEWQSKVEGTLCASEPSTSESGICVDWTSLVPASKQERLLYMSVHLLLNLAEDLNVEKKMKKHNLVEHLCKLLSKKNSALLCITVMFLKKLSVFEENKDVMKDSGIIYRLAGLLACKHEALLIAVLRLLWNLSFDEDLRRDMVKCKLIQIFGRLLKDKKLEHLVCGVLYNLSTDVHCRLKFVDSNILSIALQNMTFQPKKTISGALMALSVNLTSVPRTPDFNCEPKELEQLIMSAIQDTDPLLVKVLRNLSRHEKIKPQLVDFIPVLVHLLLRTDNSISLQVEILGVFNNISCLRGSFDSVLAETSLLQFLHSRTRLGYMEDDMLLEIVVFVGDICSTENAPLILQGGLVQKLTGVFLENRRDTELLLQLLYTFGQFLLSESTSQALFGDNPKVMVRILDLSQDYNPEVAKLAEILVNTVSEIDDDWGSRLLRLRFARLTTGRFEAD